MQELSQILNSMLKTIAGTKNFCGSESDPNHQSAAVLLANACLSFKMDVDEEVNWPDTRTCFNCRYRRWNTHGFSCYHNFPVETLPGESS